MIYIEYVHKMSSSLEGRQPGTTSKACAPRPEPAARPPEESSSESENECQPEAPEAAEEAPQRRGGRTTIFSPMWRRGQMAALQLLRKKALQRLNEARGEKLDVLR